MLVELLTRYGAGRREASEVAAHLVFADMTGHPSHGLLRAAWYIDKIEKKEIVPEAAIRVLRKTPSSAVVDGGWGFGQPIARFAMELAIRKARCGVISCVTVRRCNHIGRLGAYTALAARKGMAGIALANLHGTSHCVAPFGGIDRRLPTNPISIALPRRGRPDFLLDTTSCAVAEGKLQVYRNRGQRLPEGWIIDHRGKPAEDANLFYNEPRGAILPLGGVAGHKGFALALAIDALAGGLSGALCSQPGASRHGNACCFIAVDIRRFTPLKAFVAQVEKLAAHAKSSRPAKAGGAIHIPGEPEALAEKAAALHGIAIEPPVWDRLKAKAAAVGLDLEAGFL
jgi:uncharacterized oxidoreductase